MGISDNAYLVSIEYPVDFYFVLILFLNRDYLTTKELLFDVRAEVLFLLANNNNNK